MVLETKKYFWFRYFIPNILSAISYFEDKLSSLNWAYALSLSLSSITPYGWEWSSKRDFDPPFEVFLEELVGPSLSGFGLESPAVQSTANLNSLAISTHADCYENKFRLAYFLFNHKKIYIHVSLKFHLYGYIMSWPGGGKNIFKNINPQLLNVMTFHLASSFSLFLS